jgi:hypothetical protein
LNTSITYDVATADRGIAKASQSYTYYIQVDYNLNGAITYTATSATDTLDDAYAFSGATISNLIASNAVLNLPAVDNVQVEAGLISALNPTHDTLGLFPVELLLSVNNQGAMSGTIAISGADVIPDVVDSNLLAQLAYWPINSFTIPTANADTADVLIPLKASNLTTNFSSELSTILNYYNGVNLIESWSIALNPITSSCNNALAYYARYMNNAGSSTVFPEGDKVVAATPFNYTVVVNDYQNLPVTIISNTDIYAIIVQKT